MSDPQKSKVVYPIRLEGVQITETQGAFVAREAEKRGGARQRNGVVRDCLDFTSEHYTLFLAWLATRGTSATE